jgi:Negative regulator of beta-lactamase expression
MLQKKWLINEQGWLTEARYCPSPFYNQRPENEPISLLVVHGISLPPGQFGGPYIDALFTGHLDPDFHPYFAAIAHLEVSAHCLIRRDGEVVQYVSFLDRAWHAGRSQFEGRENCNDFSIGIELEGTDDSGYTEAQYQQLAMLTTAIQDAFPAITPARITGHADVAPGRKTDPGASFDWEQYRTLIK